MDEQARRVGRNEALFRQINEKIEGMEGGIAAIADQRMHIVCECGDLVCNLSIPVPVDVYESIRTDPALFFVRPGHEIPSAESVVEANDVFYVVRKHDGGPGELAEATDPRA